MDRNTEGGGSGSRFASYVEHIASTLGHADRRTPFRSSCAGLILPGDRKSVEPIAARIEPRRVQGAHQSLHHFVANADWSQEDLLRRVRAFVLPAIEKSGRISAWIVDDRAKAYPVQDEQTLSTLGFDGYHAPLVPDSWIKVLGAGVPLSTALALCPPGSAPAPSDTGAGSCS